MKEQIHGILLHHFLFLLEDLVEAAEDQNQIHNQELYPEDNVLLDKDLQEERLKQQMFLGVLEVVVVALEV